jgi:hypothetical protein
MNPKHTLPTRDDLLKQKVVFCTECGAQLENFCVSAGVDDIESIKKTLAQCKKDGKFVGDFCSKLFIADTELRETLWEDLAKEKSNKTL